MSIVNQYNLIFGVSNMQGFIPRPYIAVNSINGNSLNREIASFLEPNGVQGVDSIKFDIISLLDNGKPVPNVNIWGYHDSESIELRYLPPSSPVIVFNTGGTEVLVPANDFLQILDEWKAFVASVPTPHWLENR
jgi:hypothetical protein